MIYVIFGLVQLNSTFLHTINKDIHMDLLIIQMLMMLSFSFFIHSQQRSLDYHGVPYGTRTRDPPIKSRMLSSLVEPTELMELK